MNFAAALQRHWWLPRRSWLAQLLRPLSWVFAGLVFCAELPYRLGLRRPNAAPVPTVVVGNFVVGGAGKTPTVMALVQALQDQGWRPGVISRGYGANAFGARPVDDVSTANDVGDEPLLIQRRTGVPVWVGAKRVAVAQALCKAHPEVNVLVSDDGLQHHALDRDFECIVFDERGVGNGLLLPGGPLRQRLPATVLPHQFVLYNAERASTPLPGLLVQRRLGLATPLASWLAGSSQGAQPLQSLRGRELLAVAGIAAPERFFGMLREAGLTINTLPMPDHHPFDTLPWAAQTTDVLVTEKDAVKLRAEQIEGTRVWVVGLDFVLPPRLLQALFSRLQQKP